MTFKQLLDEVRSWFRNLRYSTGRSDANLWIEAVDRVQEWYHNVTGDRVTVARHIQLLNAYHIYI